ncbi:MAG TPA: hypothetical protein VGG33_22395 [Polyangia bacterium]
MKRAQLGLFLLVIGAPAGASAQSDANEAAEEFPPALELAPPTVAELEARVERTESLVLNRQPALSIGGYIDFGFFAARGNGSGYVQDFGHTLFPEYAGRFGWVFLGDLLAPAVNTRGEAADLGDAPGVARFDSVNSQGAPGFIINEVTLALRAQISSSAVATASLNVAPRTGNEFALGDSVDLDIAQVEWLPTASQRTSIFVGKMDSVIGIEYRERKADRRFGITPSLIARYTTGPALGLKLRSKLGSDDWLVVALALTNGSNTTEPFHFYNEVDSNAAKTGSGRISARLPLPGSDSATVEVGLSGSFGAQDRSRFNSRALWFAGVDLLAQLGKLALKGQWLTGRSPGSAAENVYALDLKTGSYLEADYMFNASFGVLLRAEQRNAEVSLGDERLYLTKSWRATTGVRLVFNEHALCKAEYLFNREYGGLPQVRNDVFTSSLVLTY